jgi:outer membrane protein
LGWLAGWAVTQGLVAHPTAQAPVSPNEPQQISAFPNTPKAPPPRIQDLAVPPAPITPGSPIADGRDFSAPIGSNEAVRIALHLQPSLGNQVGAIGIQQGRTRQIGSIANPQVLIGAGYDSIQSISGEGRTTTIEAGTTGLPLGVSPIYPVTANAAVRQLLFDFNMTRNLVRQSEALERSAEQTLSVAQENLILNVKTDFYDYVNAERVVKVDEANVANRQRQLDLASAQLKAGTGQPTDAITAQTSKSQGILILNEARDQAEQARVLLLQQMGVDPLTPVIPADETASGADNVDAKMLTQLAIRNRPEVKSALQALLAAKYGLSAAKVTDYPALYAELGAGANGSDFTLRDNTANFGIGIQFPLFDGGNRSGAVKSARGQIMTSQGQLDTAVLQVRTDVAGAYMSLKSAIQRVQIANNEVVNAQEAVRVAEGRYSAGIGLFLDITTAQNLLLTAQTDQSTARNTLDLARTNLRRATGEILTDVK